MEETTDLSHSREVAQKVSHNLKRLAKEQDVTDEAIAKETGMKQPSVNRLFSGRFAPRLDLVILILGAISKLSSAPKQFTLADIDYSPEDAAEGE